MDKTSMTLGWLVGRQIAGQRRTQEKQPIAYLYNGVQLPPLPELDREKYPYAVIQHFQDGAILYLTDARPYSYVLNDGVTVAIRADGETKSYSLRSLADEWDTHIVNSYMYFYGTEFIWTNTDILYADSTVAFSASDPIPVYE